MAALVLVLVIGVALYPRHNTAPQVLREAQLTTNAAEASLTAAAISPDGNYSASPTSTASRCARPRAVKLATRAKCRTEP